MTDMNPHLHPTPPALHDACALFLDVDGTLSEFGNQPDLVDLPPGALDILGRLSERLGGALALVSGRPLLELDRLFSPRRFPAAGLHGQQFRGIAASQPVRGGEALSELRCDAALLARRYPGVLVEDKGANLAIHWRAVPDAADSVRRLIRSHLPRLPGYRLQPGDHVAELMPAEVDKGHAVRTLMAEAPFRGRRPVFVGDDLTDEFGFAAVNARGGWSVQVGTREPSLAVYRLADPTAVYAWLRRNTR